MGPITFLLGIRLATNRIMQPQRFGVILALASLLTTSCNDGREDPRRREHPLATIQRRFPAAATAGTAVALTGLDFGDTPGTVWVGDQRATAVSWSTEQVVFKAPATTASACTAVQIETADGRRSNRVTFAYGAHDVWEPWSEAPAAMPAVWTGTEMIVWGGATNAGARYNPATDSWTAMSRAPGNVVGIFYQTDAWTGSEMIVWGPGGGSRYDPRADVWRAISLSGAPRNQLGHSAVWTGNRMITFGGDAGRGNAVTEAVGGSYDPATDTWVFLPQEGAPTSDIAGHSAVWDGFEMIVFGGRASTSGHFSPGGYAYAPLADRWRTLSTLGAPGLRANHGAIWTGTRMLLWGGYGLYATDLQDGFIYDPKSDVWQVMNTQNAPALRYAFTAWTGTELLVWPGWRGSSNEKPMSPGGSYNPVSDQWSPIPRDDEAPIGSSSAVWSGEELLVWGDGVGRRYSPKTKRWAPMASPADRWNFHGRVAAHWTGSEMLIWGRDYAGASMGGRYQPSTHTWLPVAEARDARPDVTVWTGTNLIAAGGYDWKTSQPTDTVESYVPASNTWTILAPLPEKRALHVGAWTGTKLIVWGGKSPTYSYGAAVSTGAWFDPLINAWHETSTIEAPSRRYFPAAIWTGSSMLVYGGWFPYDVPATSGAQYFPDEDRWQAIANGPASVFVRSRSIWAEGRWLLAGGDGERLFILQFEPSIERWRRTALPAEWYALSTPSLVWTGSEAIVFAGTLANGEMGALAYNPANQALRRLNPGCTCFTSAPTYLYREQNVSVWTGSTMLVWGPTGGMTYWP